MDNEFNISELVVKSFRQELTDEEQAQLQNWINESEVNKQLFEELTNKEMLQKEFLHFDSIDSEAIWTQTLAGIQQTEENPPRKISLVRTLFGRIAAAVVLLLGIAIGGMYFKGSTERKSSKDAARDIYARNDGATLILSDGSEVMLSSESATLLVEDGGTKISQAKDGTILYNLSTESTSPKENTFNTIRTVNGQRFAVVLPDLTRVWINAASQLKFPTSFKGLSSRRIELEGEAYFEVAKNEKQPFIVSTGNQEVQVLGTHFNVEGYSEEPAIRTSLAEGSVRVLNTNNQKSVLLKPGQQSVIAEDNILVKSVNAKSVISWKANYFDFEDEELSSIMRKISRWYNVEVTFEGKVLPLYFTGTINRSKSLYETLKILELTNNIQYRIESAVNTRFERRVVIMN